LYASLSFLTSNDYSSIYHNFNTFSDHLFRVFTLRLLFFHLKVVLLKISLFANYENMLFLWRKKNMVMILLFYDANKIVKKYVILFFKKIKKLCHFYKKKWRFVIWSFHIKKNTNKIWVIHTIHPIQPRNKWVYPTRPNIKVGGYFGQPNPEYHIWFEFLFYLNSTQTGSCTPLDISLLKAQI
jgi:hypothetical protein